MAFDSADKWLFWGTWTGRKVSVILNHLADFSVTLICNQQSCEFLIISDSLCTKAVSWVTNLYTCSTLTSRCSAGQEVCNPFLSHKTDMETTVEWIKYQGRQSQHNQDNAVDQIWSHSHYSGLTVADTPGRHLLPTDYNRLQCCCFSRETLPLQH